MKQLLFTTNSDDGHPTITITHHEIMAQVSLKYKKNKNGSKGVLCFLPLCHRPTKYTIRKHNTGLKHSKTPRSFSIKNIVRFKQILKKDRTFYAKISISQIHLCMFRCTLTTIQSAGLMLNWCVCGLAQQDLTAVLHLLRYAAVCTV